METDNHRLPLLILLSLLLIFCLAPLRFIAAKENADIVETDSPDLLASEVPQKVALIPCKDMIDDGLFQSMKRRTRIALDAGATYIIYEIGTYGGLVKSADDISKYLILEVGQVPGVTTVAYVTTEAISAGSMISVACNDIIMLENTTIGDCAPIVMGGKLEGVEREKSESFIRAAFSRAAEANNYPEPLLHAMVTQSIEVYRVKNLKTDTYEFFETQDLPKDDKSYELDFKELVVKDTEILTLTAKKAKEYGIARTTVKNLDQALTFLQDRDNVTFQGKPMVLKLLWSEQMVRMINHPAVSSILIMLLLLGVYVELKAPGLGLPGLLAVICAVILIGSKYLHGMANWVEIVFVLLGFILLALEIFVIPGFGIAGISGIICIFLGLFGMLIKNAPDQIPWPRTDLDWAIFSKGILEMLAGIAGFFIVAAIITKYLPKMKFARGLFLEPSPNAAFIKLPVSATTSHAETAGQPAVGDQGVVALPLRPAGMAKFGDAIVNVVSQAEFLEKDTPVEIIAIHGNMVVVRKM